MREDLDLADLSDGFTVPAGRSRTLPVTAMQNSLRSFSAVAKVSARSGSHDDLHQAFAVAQVDEDDAAVVAATVDPAGHGDGLVEVAAVDEAAVVGALHVSSPAGWEGMSRRARRTRAVRPGVPGGARDARRSISGRGERVRQRGTRAAERAGGGAARSRGATTPIEMMYFSASSTVMSRSCTRLRGTITK